MNPRASINICICLVDTVCSQSGWHGDHKRRIIKKTLQSTNINVDSCVEQPTAIKFHLAVFPSGKNCTDSGTEYRRFRILVMISVANLSDIIIILFNTVPAT